ncbi:MAG: hypothetical protein AAF485_21000 [Chloroflexota bacterium]
MPKLFITLIISLMVLGSCQWLSPADEPIALDETQVGIAVQHTLEHGSYWQYIPPDIEQPATVLVVVHGTVGDSEIAIDTAATMLELWRETADQEGVVLIAPVFDNDRYGGRAGPGGGYRGLYGRDVRADEFLLQILNNVRDTIWVADSFYLYGHSAGGQFVNRFVVMHPARIKRAVISAAGFYAYPNPDVVWADGMKPLQRGFIWCDECPEVDVEITPNPDGWLKAAALPIAVVVGEQDTATYERLPPGQLGTNPVDNGWAWVEAMKQYAAQEESDFNMTFVLVAEAGHNARQTLPVSRQYLFDTP